ncbi:MAG: substrate-binding domain-containing protein [Amaricoccus sp.]
MLKTICASLAALAAATALSPAAPARAEGKAPYVIYLSNNFVGNDWRQQMQRVAQVSVDKGPLKGKVDLHIEVAEGTVQAQINSLNNIIREKPAAILVDASSDSALNPTIKRACEAGIVVISFDQTVTEPCAYTVGSDWDMIPAVLAEWMAEQLGGKGNVIVDRGLAGAPISAQLQGGYEKVLAKYPDIKIVGYYNGEYALGPEQQGVAALLAANPQVDGILTQGYGSGAMQALKDAGRPMVPVTGFSYNGSGVACVETDGAKCILGANPAWLSSEALRLAVDILETGNKPAERADVVRADFITTDPFESKLYPQAKMQKMDAGKTVFPDMPPGLTLPITPDWVEITPAEAAGAS